MHKVKALRPSQGPVYSLKEPTTFIHVPYEAHHRCGPWLNGQTRMMRARIGGRAATGAAGEAPVPEYGSVSSS
jgi:hypothetical protein